MRAFLTIHVLFIPNLFDFKEVVEEIFTVYFG